MRLISGEDFHGKSVMMWCILACDPAVSALTDMGGRIASVLHHKTERHRICKIIAIFDKFI